MDNLMLWGAVIMLFLGVIRWWRYYEDRMHIPKWRFQAVAHEHNSTRYAIKIMRRHWTGYVRVWYEAIHMSMASNRRSDCIEIANNNVKGTHTKISHLPLHFYSENEAVRYIKEYYEPMYVVGKSQKEMLVGRETAIAYDTHRFVEDSYESSSYKRNRIVHNMAMAQAQGREQEARYYTLAHMLEDLRRKDRDFPLGEKHKRRKHIIDQLLVKGGDPTEEANKMETVLEKHLTPGHPLLQELALIKRQLA